MPRDRARRREPDVVAVPRRCGAARAGDAAGGAAGRRCRRAARCPSPAARSSDCSSISSNWSTIMSAKSAPLTLRRDDRRDVVQLLRIGHGEDAAAVAACGTRPAGRPCTSRAGSGSRLPRSRSGVDCALRDPRAEPARRRAALVPPSMRAVASPIRARSAASSSVPCRSALVRPWPTISSPRFAERGHQLRGSSRRGGC